jgi:hypothetical protein
LEPLAAETMLTAARAAARVVKFPLETTSSAMEVSSAADGGRRTASMTWTTPLVPIRSTTVMRARPLMVTIVAEAGKV